MTRGFSLIEMMIALAIGSLLLVMGLSMSAHYLEKTRADTVVWRLHNLIQYGRNEAIKRNMPVVLCSSIDEQHCGGSWQNGMILFVDSQGNHQVSDTQDILRSESAILGGELSWQGFGSKNYITFLPNGVNNQQNGTFIYCATANQIQQSRGIIINKSGRPRFAPVTQQGGIINASGQEIQCA